MSGKKKLLVSTGCSLQAGSLWAQQSGEASGDASGGSFAGFVLLVVLVLWLSSKSRAGEFVRCPRCRFQKERRSFIGGRCPRCGSYEPSTL